MVAACGDDDDASNDPDPASAETLEGTTWSITSLETPDGTEEPPEDATLSFEADTVSVATGCNTGGGDVTIEGNTITFGQLATTLIGCPPDLQAWEDALFGFLEGEATFEVSGDELILTKEDSTLTLASAG
jgi:heat shock protein HslJ